MDSIKLSKGAIAMLMDGKEVEKPVVQILGFKKIAGQGGNDRFRLNISDGLHSHTFAMLATQLNPMILDGTLENNCIIRVDKIVANAVSAKKVFIVLELTVLASGAETGGRVGNPIQYTEETASMASGMQKAAAPLKQEFPQKEPTAFYGQQKASPQSAVANRGNGNMSMNMSGVGDAVVPIRDITPYNSKCTIKARVTNKSGVRTWSNSRGGGKLFSIDLLDESGEIRMTGFNTAVDQFYELLKVNDVYTFSRFSAKPANKKFTTINHDYEISFTNDSEVVPCLDTEADDIPNVAFQFTEIAIIEAAEKDSFIDVIGVCKSRGDLQTIVTRKDSKELQKRELTLVDRTNTEVVLTLWGKEATEFNDDTNPVIAVKGAKVGDFQGKSLGMSMSSTMMINPDIQEAHVLRGWYDNDGVNAETRSLGGQRGGGAAGNAPWKMMREAHVVDPSAADTGYYFRSKVTVLAMKRDTAFYKACPEEKCNKKVTEISGGLYRCEKCMKETPDYKWRIMLTTCFGDGSDSIWATCFQDQGELLLGHRKADFLGPLLNDDPDQLDAIIKEAAFKSYIVKFRAKLETYNNENRMKYVCMDVQPTNFLEYSQAIIAEIREITG